MFGEKPILGQSTYKIDNKNRIFLPPTSGRETDDEIYLCFDKEIEAYTIYPAKIIENKIKEFQKKIDESKNINELKQYKLMLLEFSYSIIRKCIVDGSGRIILGSDFIQSQNYDLIGVGSHLVLKPSDENKKNKNLK